MKLELEGYSCLCATKIFRINDIDADDSEFGEKYDICPESAEEYGCGYMKFHAYDPDIKVMEKYGIDVHDWNVICDKLDDVLSFGICGWCV